MSMKKMLIGNPIQLYVFLASCAKGLFPLSPLLPMTSSKIIQTIFKPSGRTFHNNNKKQQQLLHTSTQITTKS